jgi:hypothetical protein
MTAVEKYFFTPIYYPRSAWSVVKWWESRRPMFNLAVGGCGLLTLGTAVLAMVLPPHSTTPGPQLLIPVVAYGLMANLGYSLGAPLDLLLRRWLGDRAAAVGQALFRYGFVFSVGLTLLPLPFLAAGWLLKWFIP